MSDLIQNECPRCQGVGKIRDNHIGEYWCEACNGTGKLRTPPLSNNPIQAFTKAVEETITEATWELRDRIHETITELELELIDRELRGTDVTE
jgi:RecJ-like exonuclease